MSLSTSPNNPGLQLKTLGQHSARQRSCLIHAVRSVLISPGDLKSTSEVEPGSGAQCHVEHCCGPAGPYLLP